MQGTAVKKSKGKFLGNRLKILTGAAVISLLFSLVLHHRIFHPSLWSMSALTYIQLEIFIWLGFRFFKNIKRDAANYKRKMLLRLLEFYITVLLIAFIIFLIVYTGNYILLGGDFSFFFTALKEMEIKGFLIAILIGFSIGALFFFYLQWTETLRREQQLTREKLIFQYETLKSQVNPHFLFNSLNTLSSLVRENPDLSEEFIQKLSHTYRYILENKEKELVPLTEEIEFVRDYFYLQKIRDEEKISLKIELAQMEEALILPVSLQLLVENALKHNAATRNQPLEIIIHNEGLDKLVVRNKLKRKLQLNTSSGIGLKNLNERCKLILNREIEIQETADEFIVKVPVKIDLK
jgi:two-component system, LytTR family, sensor kinase